MRNPLPWLETMGFPHMKNCPIQNFCLTIELSNRTMFSTFYKSSSNSTNTVMTLNGIYENIFFCFLMLKRLQL